MPFARVYKSGTLAINEKMAALESAGREVVRFGFGESPFPPPKRVQSALRMSALRKDYTSVAGLPELRQKIADFHSEVDGRSLSAGQVLVAPGTKPLLFNIMQAFADCEVYIPAPSWVSYAPQARLARHKVIQIETDYESRWRIMPDSLEEAICRNSQPGRDKLLILNYPGNPDGLTYSREELIALSETLDKRGVWVLSDEIYGLLHHRGAHVSLANVYPRRTLVTTGMSKWCGAGGWRLGAVILPADAPDALRDALIGLGSEVYSCAPTPIQAAAMLAYQLDDSTHSLLRGQREILAVIGKAVHAALLAAGVRVHAPEGGFYLLCDFSCHAETLARRDIKNDSDLCERLLEDRGVALLPGSAFGLPEGALTARLAYVDFDGGTALAAWRAGGDILSHADTMLAGVKALGDWLN